MRIYVTNNVVKQQLSKTETAFKFENSHGNFFKFIGGQDNGNSLSLTLFDIYINEMEANFNSVESEPPILVNSNIGSLVFADDLLVISESKEGLQNSINKLSDFCDNW